MIPDNIWEIYMRKGVMEMPVLSGICEWVSSAVSGSGEFIYNAGAGVCSYLGDVIKVILMKG